MQNITTKNINSLYDIIKYSATNHLNINETIEYSKITQNKFIKEFFNNLIQEISLETYNEKFSKYLDLINIMKNMFKDKFEFGGGKQFRFFHSLYVANLSTQIFSNLNLNDNDKEIIILSSIFHDIGKSIDAFKYVDERGFDKYEIIYNTGRHEDLGVKIANKILLKNNIKKENIELILKSISYNNSNTIYENILHEADNIAEIGFMGIWRFFYFKASENKELKTLNNFWFNKIRNIKIQDMNNCKFNISKNIMKKNIEIIDLFIGKL